ncbi:transposase [Nonomuraea corallina]|uniref:transposase n=1 Tax=Nonomuraea corallina TaxID=2989783 RepID=UPI0038CDC07A
MQLERWRLSRATHDSAKIVTDLALTLALGGDCLADIAMLRSQPELFGPVASDPTVSRLIDRLAADPVCALKVIRAARATARQCAWQLAGHRALGADDQPVIVDLDATIVISHSDKQHTAPTWKKNYGFYPMAAFADHVSGSQRTLQSRVPTHSGLRGNASSIRPK